MEKIHCPVCGTSHNIGDLCPECGFEPHFYTEIPSEAIKQYEQQRISSAKRVWDELQSLRNAQEKAKQPVGFLITERLVVYCLYEGVNGFGAGVSDIPQDVQYQNLLIPGIQILPGHFEIEVQKDEKRTIFLIRRTNPEGVDVYLNTLTQKVDSTGMQLNSGDSILLASDPNAVNVELRFRKNITR